MGLGADGVVCVGKGDFRLLGHCGSEKQFPVICERISYLKNVSTLGAGFLTSQKPRRRSGRVGPCPALPGHQVGRQRGLLDFLLLAFKLVSKPLRKVFPEHFAEERINQKFESEKNSLNTLTTT